MNRGIRYLPWPLALGLLLTSYTPTLAADEAGERAEAAATRAERAAERSEAAAKRVDTAVSRLEAVLERLEQQQATHRQKPQK